MSDPVPAAVLDPKRLTTLQAHAALAGYTLEQLADGSLVVERWGLLRRLPDLEAAEAWLDAPDGES